MANTTRSRRQWRRGRIRATDSTSVAGESCITASVPSSAFANQDADRVLSYRHRLALVSRLALRKHVVAGRYPAIEC